MCSKYKWQMQSCQNWMESIFIYHCTAVSQKRTLVSVPLQGMEDINKNNKREHKNTSHQEPITFCWSRYEPCPYWRWLQSKPRHSWGHLDSQTLPRMDLPFCPALPWFSLPAGCPSVEGLLNGCAAWSDSHLRGDQPSKLRLNYAGLSAHLQWSWTPVCSFHWPLPGQYPSQACNERVLAIVENIENGRDCWEYTHNEHLHQCVHNGRELSRVSRIHQSHLTASLLTWETVSWVLAGPYAAGKRGFLSVRMWTDASGPSRSWTTSVWTARSSFSPCRTLQQCEIFYWVVSMVPVHQWSQYRIKLKWWVLCVVVCVCMCMK